MKTKYKILIWIVYVVIVMITMYSCSPQKRVNRIVKNHPDLIAYDTIIFEDTVTFTTSKVEIDTITSLSSITKDTLIFRKDNMTIKTHYNYQTDSIYVFGQCDTIYLEQIIRESIPVEKVKFIESKLTWNKYFRLIATGFVVALILYFIVKSLIRKYPPRI